MNYNELIQLYFERSNAMQQYWNLYVIIVGGVLAFSSLRKQPAAITTALVCILFGLFAYNNLDAMKDTTAQRFATIEAIKQFDSGGVTATASKQVRDLLEPTLTPATFGSVKATHITSDLLTIAALCAMELRRRRLKATSEHALRRSIPRPHAKFNKENLHRPLFPECSSTAARPATAIMIFAETVRSNRQNQRYWPGD